MLKSTAQPHNTVFAPKARTAQTPKMPRLYVFGNRVIKYNYVNKNAGFFPALNFFDLFY